MPPFPLFTFIGFTIHAAVFYAVGFHCLKKRSAKIFLFLGVAFIIDAINFTTILLLFFFFPNNLTKSYLFIFNAGVIVPLAVLVFVSALVYYGRFTRKFLNLFLLLGCAGIGYTYFLTMNTFQHIPFEASFIHPAYPKLIGQNQSAGIISSLFFAAFFLYNSFWSTLFIKRRAFILGIASLLEGISTIYWTSSTASVYLFTHIIGPIGSLLIAVGIFWYEIPEETQNT